MIPNNSIYNCPESLPISIVNLLGGLGNQMFQYAFFLALKHHDRRRKFYINPIYCTVQGNYELDKVFDVPSEYIISEECLEEMYEEYLTDIYNIQEKDSIIWQAIEEKKCTRSVYNGFWQTERYFKNITYQVKEHFLFDKGKLNNQSKGLLEKIENDESSISIHIRRGDYLGSYGNRYIFGNICTNEYYLAAIEKIRDVISEPLHYYIFSDDPEWVKDNFSLENALIIDWNQKMDSWQDMCLMSACRHHIVANSSFSWWGAWLGNHEDRIVVAPDPWFNQDGPCDIIPDTWIKIQVKENNQGKKIDLTDTTIIFFAQIDSIEKKRSFQVCLEYIHSIADTNIIIKEGYYHAQEMNQIIKEIKTPIVSLWDTNIVIPVEQIDEAVGRVRKNHAVLSYPYDGHLYKIPPAISELYCLEKNISMLKKHLIYCGSASGIQPAKKVVFIDREKYLAAGGENEHLLETGFRDIEREKRIEILELPIYNTYGPAFYLYHPGVQELWQIDRKIGVYDHREFLKICKMTKDELSKYILGWDHL